MFIRAAGPTEYESEVEPLGVRMEFATESGAWSGDLYRKAGRWWPTLSDLHEILVDGDSLPCEVSYLSCFSVQTGRRTFVPLESLIVALYENLSIVREPSQLFTELGVTLDFWRNPLPRRLTLIPDLASRGFGAIGVRSSGRRLCLEIEWDSSVDPNRRGLAFDVAAVEFRPRPDGTLGPGKWYELRECFAGTLFFKQLRKIVNCQPIELFTEAGKAHLLSLFEWPPLARLTNTQARHARLEFIRAHSDLVSDRRKLAEAMRKAGLYSANTTPSQIAKFIPSLLANLCRVVEKPR